MSQAGGMSPCTQSIMMGGIMGCGVGGAAGTVLGFAGGLFGGQRKMALIKNTGRQAMTMGASFAMIMSVAQGLRGCLNS
ncbi:unnamed protein product [Oikopleura dioica]|uniref:Uncharacterized protein n=1 Tax=Oikopleura dioica TaxID=34765 RepID=E4XE82_OIKDI|nr:unnamed protein product [Oikopleura dioica]CBY36255.1 unnamed protein product [Oikopleura dioica]